MMPALGRRAGIGARVSIDKRTSAGFMEFVTETSDGFGRAEEHVNDDWADAPAVNALPAPNEKNEGVKGIEFAGQDIKVSFRLVSVLVHGFSFNAKQLSSFRCGVPLSVGLHAGKVVILVLGKPSELDFGLGRSAQPVVGVVTPESLEDTTHPATNLASASAEDPGAESIYGPAGVIHGRFHGGESTASVTRARHGLANLVVRQER